MANNNNTNDQVGEGAGDAPMQTAPNSPARNQVPAAPAEAAPAPRLTGGIALRAPSFKIQIPDLRNGSLVDIQQAAPRAAMSVLYHWPIIGGLTHDKYIDSIDHVVRAIFAQGVHVLGANATEANIAAFRKKAIVLGAIRVGAVAAFKLTREDLVRDELSASGMVYDAQTNVIGMSTAGSTSGARWTAARSMQDITPEEEGVVAACVYMGMAIPVLQGVSLVMTGHHYIPTTYNLFAGLKRQAIGQASAEAKTWIEAMGDDFNDMAFHKATHSVSFTLKRSMAKNVEVANRLRASGHGSAAIRLPAVPSEASGGKASVALLASAKSTFAQMGHVLTYNEGLQLLADLDDAREGQQEMDACNKVVAWVEANAQTLAFCAGIVSHVHETNGTGKNTILSAYSIKRIMSDHPAQVSKGGMYARAANTILRTSMEAGTFVMDPIHL